MIRGHGDKMTKGQDDKKTRCQAYKLRSSLANKLKRSHWDCYAGSIVAEERENV